ncbi:MAG: hypothetical protein LBK99_19580 [Opitutaceae bacterium]|jgi:hypothetical protein|nr:hypothetical protein [Opitutaceae bacterium]
MKDNEILDTNTVTTTATATTTATVATKPHDAKDAKEAERAKAIKYLAEEYLDRGDTVYTILRRVSASGMTRWIDCYTIVGNAPIRITWNVAKALDIPYDHKVEGLRIGGCGQDAGGAVTSHLAWKLFGNNDALRHKWL